MRFFYLRDENNHPIGCVASDLNSVNQTVSFAVSVCNPMDQFKKPQAKEIAAGRLALGLARQIPVTADRKGRIKAMIMKIIRGDHHAQRARDAADLWLKNHSEM